MRVTMRIVFGLLGFLSLGIFVKTIWEGQSHGEPLMSLIGAFVFFFNTIIVKPSAQRDPTEIVRPLELEQLHSKKT